MQSTDVLILGAGPAGSATAIGCASAGLRTTILDRCLFPRFAPGESLHPGVEPLLERLGVLPQVSAAGFARYAGHWVTWGGPPRFESFGADQRGTWLGYHAWRPQFDSILLARARLAGARVLQPCRPLRLIAEAGRVQGVVSSAGPLRASIVVDATGRRQWLARSLGVPMVPRGGRRIAWYGYVAGHCSSLDTSPSIAADQHGWSWIAQVRPELYQWTRLNWHADHPVELPNQLRDLAPYRKPRSADVTWRLAAEPAGHGYFLTGDAAAVLDPASSHGVLKALMSGMLAGQLIVAHLQRGAAAADCMARYCAWLRDLFAHDVSALEKLYAQVTGETMPV